MALFSLILALLLEQFRPVDPKGPVFRSFGRLADALASNFNAGERRHGVLGWLCAVLPWVVAANIVYWLLYDISFLLGWAWSVIVLYLTMGFRQFSHGYTTVLESLRAGQLDRARMMLGVWRNEAADEFTQSEVAKVAIEQGLLGAHRHVFGVIAWFVFMPALFGTVLPGVVALLLSGPGGAVLYRLAVLLNERWGAREDPEFAQFGGFARDAFRYLDWVPARLTAISFAIVGDFEDAVYCWRSQAAGWNDPHQGVVLASGAGAIGVRLGETLHSAGSVNFRPELGLGDDADLEHMQSAVGLIWRTLVMWVLVIALVTIASWIG
ncbi:MAG: CobD/CbiB family protein [Betaproteobacteria bacterium]